MKKEGVSFQQVGKTQRKENTLMNAKPHSRSGSLEEEFRSLQEEIWSQFRAVLKQELKWMISIIAI